MSSQQQQQQQQQHQQQQQQQQHTNHDPPASAPPSLILDQTSLLPENNLHQLDALTLQQLTTNTNQNLSNMNADDIKASNLHSTSLADIQKELDRVRQMKNGRTYSSPTSSLCSRLTTNPFNGSNNNIDISAMTHSVHFNDQLNQANLLPFSSTFITSIPESIVPASSSSSTADNHFIPITSIESPTLEDREVFETFHTKQTSMPGIAIRQPVNALNRTITSSETDLIASLHRSVSKQALDNQSEHGTTYSGTSDEMIFLEWDKERNLFQDYINSLRTEIRVLLQERSEYQTQIEAINNNLSEHKRVNLTQFNTDQSKFDLLQKSLEEKNLVLEQLQKEYENIKEKNTNLTRKISVLRCDAKSHTGVIDELKQKIAELTVDIQNHILVKRRLEVSMMNLESDFKIMDSERLRLNDDVKDVRTNKHDLEKLLQQANVQIAEQGSTIEMLRSDNIHVRSQLSTTQRRMLQEKQQVMDYLRQIENDLVEKEQIKQREAMLRKDFEKLQLTHKKDRQEIEELNSKINDDKQKLVQLEQERLQLLKTIENQDDNKMKLETELNSYKSATKNLYTHFRIPFDSLKSIDNLIPILEDRYRQEQVSHARVHHVPLVQSTSELNNQQETEEIRQLREDLTATNMKLKQSDEANQAWNQYQENQLSLLRDRLKLTDIDNLPFEDIIQQIENRFDDLNNQLSLVQHVDIDTSKVSTEQLQSVNTQKDGSEEHQQSPNASNQSSPAEITKSEEEIRQLQENLDNLTIQWEQLNQANLAWQEFHQTQLDSFKTKVQSSFPLENTTTFDDIAQNIIVYLDQIQSERDTFKQQLETSEKFNNELRAESVDDIETIKQTYTDTINELNQQLTMVKQHNDQLETEKSVLNQQLEEQATNNIKQEQDIPTTDSTTLDSKLTQKHISTAPIHEAQIHTVTSLQASPTSINEYQQEIQQLKDNIALLTTQHAQLDEANRAWQLYHQTQLNDFRNIVRDHVTTDDSSTLDQLAQQIIDQIIKEKQDFSQQYQTLQQQNEDLRSESATNLDAIKQSYMNTITELNQQLLAIKEKTQQTQKDILQKHLEPCLSIDYSGSFGDIIQQIVLQLNKERNESNQKYQTLEKLNDELRSESTTNLESIRESYVNTIDELNKELNAMKEAYDRIDNEKQLLNDEIEKLKIEIELLQALEKVSTESLKQSSEKKTDDEGELRESVVRLTEQCARLNEANCAWKEYQETQSENLRSKLSEHLPIDKTILFDDIAQRIIDHINKEKEDSTKRYDELQSESATNLETIKQSYINTIDELNKELLSIKEECAQLNTEKQILNDQLMKQCLDLEQKQDKEITELLPMNLSDKVANLGSTSGSEQETEEIRALRENFAILTSQYAVINEANRAWQEFHQTQLNNFRTKMQGCIKIPDNYTFDQIAQQIVDEMTKQQDDFNKQYQILEKTNTDIQAESIQENMELLAMKEQYEILLNQSPSKDQIQDTQAALELANAKLLQQQTEMSELRENLNSLTIQLDETVRSWQKSEQKQFDSLKHLLPTTNKISLEEIVQEIIQHVNILTTERNTLKENYEYLNHQHEQLKQYNQTDDDKLKQDFLLLQNQCTQLDTANRAWQLFYSEQINVIKNKLKDYMNFDSDATFDQIIQLITEELQKQNRLNDSQEIVSLKNECQNLEQQLKENQYSIDSLKNNLQSLSNENEQLKQSYQELQQKNDLHRQQQQPSPFESREISKQKLQKQMRHTPVSEAQVHRITPVQAVFSTDMDEEIQQLRINLASFTSQCSQLTEANLAWQQFHQNQLEIFRNKLHDCISLDDSSTLEQIAQHIINHLDELQKNNQLNESTHNQNLEQLNQKLIDAYKECEEMRENNAQLLVSKQQIEKKSEEQEQHNNNLNLDNQQLQMKLNDTEQRLSQMSVNSIVQRVDSPRENIGIHNVDRDRDEEIRQLRTDLAAATAHCQSLDEANRAWQKFQNEQIESFRQKFQEQIPSLNQMENTSLDFIAQEIGNHLNQLNIQHDNLMHHMNTLKDEIQVQKQQLGRPGSTDGENWTVPRRSKVREALIHTVTPAQASPTSTNEYQQEIQQLKDNITQLDEANRAWQLYHQTQLNDFRNNIRDYITTDDSSTLDQLAQQIIDQIIKEKQDFSLQYQTLQQLNDDFRSESATNLDVIKESYINTINELNQQLYAMKENSEPINNLSSSSLSPNSSEKISFNTEDSVNQQQRDENEEFRKIIVSLTSELDETKQAWQNYQQTQKDILRNYTEPYLSIDYNDSFGDIIQQIIIQLDKERNESNQKCQTIEKINDELRLESARNLESIRESHMNTIDELNKELNAMKEAYDRLDQQQTIEKVSTESLTDDVNKKENEELRESVVRLTEQCARLNEANCAWKEYQETQSENLRSKLSEHLPIDKTISFDDIAQQIIDQIMKEREEFNEKYAKLEKTNHDLCLETARNMQFSEPTTSSCNDVELTPELLGSKTEELDRVDRQIISEREDFHKESEDRSIALGFHSGADLSVIEEVTELQSSSFLTETEELRIVRADLSSLTSQLTEVTQANQNEVNLLMDKLKKWVKFTPKSTLNEVTHQLENHFEEQQEINSNRNETATQTTIQSLNVHIGTETNRLTYEHRQIQHDPIDMIDQETQTASCQQLLSMSDDKNLFNSDDEDDRIQEYIDELSSLSIDDLSNRLNKECHQILSKQNLQKSLYANYKLNHLALLTIHLLYNQHLTDDAKQLYNETLIRALKQEYELINNEKNDSVEKYDLLEEKYQNELNNIEKKFEKLQNKYDELLEQNELERLHSKKSFNDLTEKYDLGIKQLQLNLHEDSQNNDYEQLRKDFNNLINENELLKDYNSQMYQRKLQTDDNGDDTIKRMHSVEIQCTLSEESHRPPNIEGTSWNNDWDEEATVRHSPIENARFEQLSNGEDRNRLKNTTTDHQRISLHNTKSDSVIQDVGIHSLPQTTTVYSSALTDLDHDEDTTVLTVANHTNLTNSDENDWNSQMSSFEIPSDEYNFTSVTAGPVPKQITDSETQTDEQLQDRLTQINHKLKRALQTIKDKIHQAVLDQPELFVNITDDTIERLDHLIAAMGNQATQIGYLQNECEHMLNKFQQSETESSIHDFENQIKSLTSERNNLLELNKRLEKDIQELHTNIDTATSDQRILADNSSQTVLIPQYMDNQTVKDSEELIINSRTNETQTEEQPQDKLLHVNNKLKRALQTIKDKISQTVIERPELFIDTNDDTIERLDHLIVIIGNQAVQIDNLQCERDDAQRDINILRKSLEESQQQLSDERAIDTEQRDLKSDDTSLLLIDDCQKQINQLQEKLAANEDERTLLRERVNEVENEFKKKLDDHISTNTMYEEQIESLVQERNALVEQHTIRLTDDRNEIEHLQEELNQLKQTINDVNVDRPSVQSLQDVIQQQTNEIKDLSEKYLNLASQIEGQDELYKQKKELEQKLIESQKQIENLIHERTNLLEELQKSVVSDGGKQTGDDQHSKLTKMNSKLRRALQTFKDKICRLAIEKPGLFINISDETSERFDHILNTVQHQATRIDLLEAELVESEQHLRKQNRELQNALDSCKQELNYEYSIKGEQLVSAAPISDTSHDSNSSIIEDYRTQIQNLQQKLRSVEDERVLLREHLNEVELELRKTLDQHEPILAMYEKQLQTVEQERNAVVQLHALRSAEQQQRIDELQDELMHFKEPSMGPYTTNRSCDDIKSLQEIIQQQSDELRDMSDKYFTLSSQLESQEQIDKHKRETEELLINYENQIEHLLHERTNLIEELQKNAALLAQITDNEKQATTTNDQQHDKLIKLNNKLKRALQTIKEKIHRIVNERPELFINVGEETTERLDHLIATVENQTSQINILQSELDQLQEQYRDEIRELQRAMDAYLNPFNHERSIKTDQPVTEAPPSDLTSYISSSVFENDQKQIHELRQKLSANEDERTVIRDRLDNVQREFRKTLDECATTLSAYERQIQTLEQERSTLIQQHELQTAESQQEIEELQKEIAQLKKSAINPSIKINSSDDIQSWKKTTGPESKERQILTQKCINLMTYIGSNAYLQSEFDQLKQVAEDQLTNYEDQIEKLLRERVNLIELIHKNTSVPSVHTTDSEKATTVTITTTTDQRQDKLVKVNNKLKRALQTIKEKIQRIVTERSDLFTNIGEETNDRLDHLISTVENQTAQINLLQTELHESEEQLQSVVQQLQTSFDLYRQLDDDDGRYQQFSTTSSYSPKVKHENIQLKQKSTDNRWNDWNTDSVPTTDDKIQHQDMNIQCDLLVDRLPSITEVSNSLDHRAPSVTDRLIGHLRKVQASLSEEPSATNDWDDQNSPLQLHGEEPSNQHTLSSPTTPSFVQSIALKIQQIVTENPNLFPHSHGDLLEDIDQLIAIIKNFQNELDELENSSILRDYQKEIDELKVKVHENGVIYQKEIRRLLEEHSTSKSINNIDSQTNFDDDNSISLLESRLSDCQCQIDVLLRERISLMEQIKELAHQPIRSHVEIQTQNDSEQRISRQVFEQEMMAWSKESEQLKQFVKQIQVENKKLKDIILKFERITHDYTLENERLKQENQHLSLLSYSSVDNSTSSDTDICYLTLKCLTYEVAERTSDHNKQSLLTTDNNNDSYLKQKLIDTERQLKSIRIQNQRLKKQLETYTIQLKHVQHDVNVKNQELSLLKIETDRLRISETQYRLEVDRLKVDLQCDQVKIQQLERELIDLQREQNNTQSSSNNNIRELLELKERELNALKEKLDYTTKAHQLELEEAIKANQFSLDNVQRFEQLDQRNQEKRKELEIRLGNFCKIIKPLIDNQHLSKEKSIIDLDELQQLITDTEAEERVTNSLGPIRDCLGLLEIQMKDLHDNLIENHARHSTKWKSKVEPESSELTQHDIQEAYQDRDLFLESSRIVPMNGCSYSLIDNFIESGVHLCLDEVINFILKVEEFETM
ncbi:unnamed protein product [Adineta steineri]|uniref:Uncharacterized protein n=2 Tax=Adineta steineri TaxID=433720 RepID=A0A818SJZ8_9BILA|nr:unnamed protein product [Adineta steineri]